MLGKRYQPVPYKNAGRKFLKPQNDNDLEDDMEDLIPLSVLQQRMHPAAKEIDEIPAMLQRLEDDEKNVETGEAIDWIDGDAKLMEKDNLDDADDNLDSDEDIEQIDAPLKIKNEDAVKSLNVAYSGLQRMAFL